MNRLLALALIFSQENTWLISNLTLHFVLKVFRVRPTLWPIPRLQLPWKRWKKWIMERWSKIFSWIKEGKIKGSFTIMTSCGHLGSWFQKGVMHILLSETKTRVNSSSLSKLTKSKFLSIQSSFQGKFRDKGAPIRRSNQDNRGPSRSRRDPFAENMQLRNQRGELPPTNRTADSTYFMIS